jgi:hypothetical protein
MRKLFSIVALSFITSSIALGAESPPSDESLKRLIAVTEARKLLDAAVTTFDASMHAALQQRFKSEPISAGHQQIIDDMQGKLVALMKETLRWDTLEPVFMDVYRRTLTQSEVDGMLAFYATPAGKAVISKMPLIMQNTMAAMQSRMSNLTPQLERIEQEMMEKLKALEEKP